MSSDSKFNIHAHTGKLIKGTENNEIVKEMKEILENVSKVKGEKFADYIKFTSNLKGLISMAMRTGKLSIQGDIEPDLLKLMAATAATCNQMFGEAVGLNPEEAFECMAISTTLDHLSEKLDT